MNDARLVKRAEPWGELSYDIVSHRFYTTETVPKGGVPYVMDTPVVLNIDLTFKCNMNCTHCVAKDLERIVHSDLVPSERLIKWLNKSRFMVVVITGGEPLLPEKENDLIWLLNGIKDKGVVVDTNGTILPGRKLVTAMKRKDVLLRVSIDTPRFVDEARFRRIDSRKITAGANKEVFLKKIRNLGTLRRKGLKLAAQSVLSTRNRRTIHELPRLLTSLGITDLYVQRFIPSHKELEKEFRLDDEEYEDKMAELSELCNRTGMRFFGKLERRHNSVFLLAGEGEMYTQGEEPGQKILLGRIDTDVRYFDYVSSSEHSMRYYGADWLRDNPSRLSERARGRG